MNYIVSHFMNFHYYKVKLSTIYFLKNFYNKFDNLIIFLITVIEQDFWKNVFI